MLPFNSRTIPWPLNSKNLRCFAASSKMRRPHLNTFCSVSFRNFCVFFFGEPVNSFAAMFSFILWRPPIVPVSPLPASVRSPESTLRGYCDHFPKADRVGGGVWCGFAHKARSIPSITKESRKEEGMVLCGLCLLAVACMRVPSE